MCVDLKMDRTPNAYFFILLYVSGWGTFYVSKTSLLLFANFSQRITHKGKPALLEVKANNSVHAKLNFLLSSEFLFWGDLLIYSVYQGWGSLKKLPTGKVKGCRRDMF